MWGDAQDGSDLLMRKSFKNGKPEYIAVLLRQLVDDIEELVKGGYP